MEQNDLDRLCTCCNEPQKEWSLSLTYNSLFISNKGTHTWSLIRHAELGHAPSRVNIRPHRHTKKANLSQTAE